MTIRSFLVGWGLGCLLGFVYCLLPYLFGQGVFLVALVCGIVFFYAVAWWYCLRDGGIDEGHMNSNAGRSILSVILVLLSMGCSSGQASPPQDSGQPGAIETRLPAMESIIQTLPPPLRTTMPPLTTPPPVMTTPPTMVPPPPDIRAVITKDLTGRSLSIFGSERVYPVNDEDILRIDKEFLDGTEVWKITVTAKRETAPYRWLVYYTNEGILYRVHKQFS